MEVSEVAKDLIVKLLDRDPEKRLGMKGKGEVLRHAFFVDVDIERIATKKSRAPFVPKCENPKLMREKTQKVVRIKDLHESVVPQEGEKLILQ